MTSDQQASGGVPIEVVLEKGQVWVTDKGPSRMVTKIEGSSIFYRIQYLGSTFEIRTNPYEFSRWAASSSARLVPRPPSSNSIVEVP